MPGQDIIIAVGLIGLAVSVSTPAAAIDVPGMTCSEVGSFAQRVAQQKATGVALNQAVPRLRRSFRREHADTEHELEKIVRAIYEMPIFSTVGPEEVGNAYRTACEKGQPRWSREAIDHWASSKRPASEIPPENIVCPPPAGSLLDRASQDRTAVTANQLPIVHLKIRRPNQ